MKNILNNFIYFLFKQKLLTMNSSLFHGELAFKINEEMIKNFKLENSFEKPKDLTIISFHNYKKKPLFEQNMDFLGIEYLSIEAKIPYYFTNKTELVYSMIKNGEIKTNYTLICDSKDTIFTKNPKDIIQKFNSFNCDMLFASTKWDFIKKTTYNSHNLPQKLFMKEQKNWVDRVLGRKKYINCGIYMFKNDSVLDIFEECMKYISYGEVSTLKVPYGNDDQTIYRWIEPQFYPRIKVDSENTLFTNDYFKI